MAEKINFKGIEIPVNYRSFVLDFSTDPEKKGYRREEVEHIHATKSGLLNSTRIAASLMPTIAQVNAMNWAEVQRKIWTRLVLTINWLIRRDMDWQGRS